MGKDEYLTVSKLKEILDSQINEYNKDALVVIDAKPMPERASIGTSPHMITKTPAYFGFDWDTGLFFICPSKPLFWNDEP